MISAILFDLDGTLLENDIHRFLPAYLQSLGEFMAPRLDPSRLTEALMAGTRSMLRNDDPEITLQQAFDAVFFPMVGLDRASLGPEFDRFYQEGYPLLKGLTRPVETAARAVECAFARRWKVVVATNPLFPMAAMDRRLEWAGIDPAGAPFDLVTSYETMHFAKPRPEYVAEVLGRIVAQPAEAVFIGNDPSEDIAPARALGLASYRVRVANEAASETAPGEGSMPQLAASLAVENGDPGIFLPSETSPCALPALLSGHLGALLHFFGQTTWPHCPVEEGWGPVEIACHLRDVEREITQPRLKKMVAEDNPYLPAVESDQWAEERNYRSQNGPEALQEFTRARKETIARLRGLSPADWQRPGRHALFGPTTLAEQAQFSARHDLLHIEQLQGALAVCGQ
jgi:FMN phosphatase YigB (HAD superfamily)